MEAIKIIKPQRPCVGHQDVRRPNATVQLAVRFTDEQFKEIIRRADRSGRSAAAVVRELVDRALSR